jgi:tetratricopeptide (TPR) repeat protein
MISNLKFEISNSKKAVAVAIVLTCAGAAMAKMSAEEAAKVFQEANVAFGEGNKARGQDGDRLYEKAILGYKRLAEEGGIRNAKLYANLGNAYLMTGDIGRSVLWYRRGLELSPGNAEITRNLAYARGKRLDKVEPPAQKRVMQTLFFWHYDLSLRTRFVVACAAMGALCLLLTGVVWMGRRAYFTAGAVMAAILLAAMAGSLVVEEAGKRSEGVIVAPEVTARQGDGENYPDAFKDPLHAGTEFVVVEQRGGWVRIELADSSGGWVPAGAAELF